MLAQPLIICHFQPFSAILIGMPSKTKILSAATGFLLSLICMSHGEWLLIPHAWAQSSGVIPDTQGGIMGTLLFGVGILNFLAFFLLKLLSYLVDPDTISGVTGGSDKMILQLWQISRDVMNLIFAMLLLIGAIMTIVFGKQEIVKQHLVKFLLSVILVNFSWFFPRVVIDLANVTTATIYGLPNLVNSQCKWIDKDGTPKDCVVVTDILFFEDVATGTCPTLPAGPPAPAPLEMGSIMKVCLAPLISGSTGTNNGFGIINGLVANHGRLIYLGVIAGSPPAGGAGGTVTEGLRFIIILTTVLFLHVMLVFPLAALTMAMIIRIPILWLTISFMPFMFIGFIVGDNFIKVNSMEIFTKHFITAAFLPAIVAIPFSIGYIMLNAVATMPISQVPSSLTGKVAFFPQAQNWWQVIWILLSFMIIWMGSRAAMKRDEIYSKFTEPIFNVGNSFMKLPLTLPLIPHDTQGGKSSISDISSMAQNPRALGMAVAGKNPFDKPKTGGAAAQASAKDPNVLSALNKINTTGAAEAIEISLLRQDMKSHGHSLINQASAREYLVTVKAEDAKKPVNEQKLSGITDIDRIAKEIAKPDPKKP